MLTAQNTIALTAALILSLSLIINTAHDPLSVSLGFSVLAFACTVWIIPQLQDTFVKANVVGKDVNKKEQAIIPESMGVVAAMVYLVCLFLFIPFPFMEWFSPKQDTTSTSEPTSVMLHGFPFHKLIEFLSAVSTIQSMVLLGFADDIFDIRWRNKILLPMIASIPLLMTYHTNHGVTAISIPLQLRSLLGAVIDIGWLYYVYMSLLAIFCTHSINILAGINGVEAGQSLVIALSVCTNDWLYVSGIKQYNGNPASVEAHLFSLYMLMPFVGVTVGLLIHNWYPSRVFVGDTYCYFAGMTFAVVGILGHFSKTLLLFFLPQIFNFIYSLPQLFRLIPCPRHRMPSLNPKTNRLEPTTASLIATTPHPLGMMIINIFSALGLVRVQRNPTTNEPINVTNLTLLNLVLLCMGPMKERDLTLAVMVLQVLGSVIAFGLRYWAVKFVYDLVS